MQGGGSIFNNKYLDNSLASAFTLQNNIPLMQNLTTTLPHKRISSNPNLMMSLIRKAKQAVLSKEPVRTEENYIDAKLQQLRREKQQQQ